MDENQKKIVINKYDDKEFWRRYYSPANRRWFIRRIIDHLIASGRPDQAIEAETKDIIDKAKVIVSERIKNQGSPATDLKNFWEDRTTGVSLRQIVYNIIALHPQLLLPVNKAFADFLIDRRIRMVKRMQFFVNPNLTRRVFLYPGTVPVVGAPEPIARLNDSTRNFWTGLFELNGIKTKPFVLNDAGKANPVSAVTRIFDKHSLGAANFFYCDDVIGILLMDSLIVSANPANVINKLVAEGEEHFKIDHPYQHYGTWPHCAVLLGMNIQPVNSGTDVEIQLGTSSHFYDDAPLAFPHNVHEDRFFDIDQPKQYLIALGNTHEILKSPMKVNFKSRKLLVKKVNNNYDTGAKIYIAKNYPPPNDSKPFPVYHFINDSRSDKTYFEQSNIDLDDVQVADVIKVKNHLLYRRYYTNAAAGEENAILMESSRHSERSTEFDNGFKLAGHGMSAKDGYGMPVKQMVNELMDHVNNVIGILTSIVPIHLKNFQTNGIAGTSTVNVITRAGFHFFEYDIEVTTTLKSTFLGTTSRNNFSFNGFVIKQSASDEKKFEVINIGTTDSTREIDKTTGLPLPTFPQSKIFSLDEIFFQGNVADYQSIKQNLSNWGLFYLNTTAMLTQKFPLFEKDNKTPRRFRFGDLKRDRTFFYCFDTARTLMVTRPKVDFSSGYRSFLKNSRAIP